MTYLTLAISILALLFALVVFADLVGRMLKERKDFLRIKEKAERRII